MDLQKFLSRAQEIEVAILNVTAQLNSLQGHKAETAHWVQQLQGKEDETQVETPVPPVVE